MPSSDSIVQCQLKLILRPSQERQLVRWLWRLTGVYNWAIRKIELDANNQIYHSTYDLEGLLVGHHRKLDVPLRVAESTVRQAHQAWQRCFRKLARKPRLKGNRNRLNSILIRQPLRSSTGNRIKVPTFGTVKFHQQDIPEGPIKNARLVRRASGWYLCLTINAAPAAIEPTGHAEIGIDPGFQSLLTLSTGEKVEHPHELARTARRLAQAQRGRNRRLTARLLERQTNQRKDRNHKLSRRLVAENALIAWSKDRTTAIARTFGKSVASAAHGQLRHMLTSKCRAGGRQFIEAPSRNSTRTCSACGALTGPTGWAGLSVRQWVCVGCGTEHDRDVNAAVNTLIVGRGMRLERAGNGSPEIAA